MALTTQLEALQTFISSSWARVAEVEQVLVFEAEGNLEIHTVLATNRREVCYKIYDLEQRLIAKFPELLFDFNLALNRYKDQGLGTSKAWVVYDRVKQGKHARPR